MNKNELKDLIKREVWSAAAAKLKQEKAAASNKPQANLPPKLDDREFENILFNGGYEDEGFNKIYGLAEGAIPQIDTQEIHEFEKKFAEVLTKYPNVTVTFDEQGAQRKSMTFKPNPKGIAVTASGYLQLGNEGNVRWMFSIPNGCRLETEGVELTQENKDLFPEIYNFYNEWQQEWRQKLTGNEEAPEEFGDDMMPGQEQPGMVPGLNSAPGGDPSGAGGEAGAAPAGI
jgi:hypothetical protein